MDGEDYSDGITKTPIVIDNVYNSLIHKYLNTNDIGFWVYQSRIRGRRKASPRL
jgi:hypothetical protein